MVIGRGTQRTSLLGGRMLVLFVTGMLPACSADSDRTAVSNIRWQTVGFVDACTPLRTLSIPVQDSDAYPVTLGYPVFLPNGSFIVTDAKAAKLYRLDSLGVSQGVFGGLGDGPGEFRLPSQAALWDDSLIAVVDPSQQRVTVLDTMGRFVRSFRTEGFAARRIAILPRQRVALTGLSEVGGDLRMLAVYDNEGERMTTSVAAPPILARLTPRIDDVLLAVTSQGTVVMSSIVLPLLFVVNGESVTQLPFSPPTDTWHQLEPLAEPPGTMGEVRTWIRGASFLNALGLVGDSVLVVGWNTGQATANDGNEGDGANYLAAINMRGRAARLIKDAPGRLLTSLGARWSLVTDARPDVNVVQWFDCDRALEGL